MKDEIYAQWLQYTQIITPFCKLYNHCWVLCQSKTLNTPIQRTLAQSTWHAYKQLYAILICQTADRPIVNSLHRNTHGDTMLPHSPPTHVSVWMHTPIFGIGFRFTPPRKLAHALTFSCSILTHTCKAQTPRLFLLPQNWFSVLSTQHCSFNPTFAAHCYSKNEHRAEFSPNSTPTVSAKPERKRKKKAQFSFTGTTCANASEHNR